MTTITLPAETNQALGLGRYAIDFLSAARPSSAVLQKVEQFHTDSVACGIAALACGMNAPTVLRDEALTYTVDSAHSGATCFGSTVRVRAEKAIVANSSAVRELDSNGTNFGFNPATNQTAGEFGHNDFYPVAVAAAHQTGADGHRTLLAMLCIDEIRGRLAEAFALKNYKIDHVLHGAIASAAVYGAMMGATAERIESAIGMVVAHYVPFRAIRAGHQLSDSKGASAALSTEMAVVSAQRAMNGFVGPADIFRNPQAVFCLFEPPAKEHASPFDLHLARGGDDFAVMGMHFKLGLYEHQSAGAIAGLLSLLQQHPSLLDSPERIRRLRITIYQPAFGIIGDPHKRDPRTRQSADHSMVYIVSTTLRKAFECKAADWNRLMLLPADYDDAALFHPLTRQLMERIDFVHGGPEYDRRYPDGIPTTVDIESADGASNAASVSSGLVMYPKGHARNHDADVAKLLESKWRRLIGLGAIDTEKLLKRLTGLADQSPDEIAQLYAFGPINSPSA
jgi:2-methylcitrate dehydratase